MNQEPKKEKTLYAVYSGFGRLEIQSVKVIPWGKGYKAADRCGSALAFDCRSIFVIGQYAESELEAWERFRHDRQESVEAAKGRICGMERQIGIADEKIAALKS